MKDNGPSFFEKISRWVWRVGGGKSHWLFRAVLMFGAAIIVVSGWNFSDRQKNYTEGEPSPKTYYAVSEVRYEDHEATQDLRKQASNRITDVIVRNEAARELITKRIENLKTDRSIDFLDPSLYSIFKALPAGKRREVIAVIEKINKDLWEHSYTPDQQAAHIWQELASVSLSQPERNIAFQILQTLSQTVLESDKDIAENLREIVAGQIPTVMRDFRVGSIIVQQGQTITPFIANLLRMQGYPDALFPRKHLAFVLFFVFMWSLWPVLLERRRKKQFPLRQWLYMAVLLVISWALQRLIAVWGVDGLTILLLSGWFFLTLPASFAFHLVLGGGYLGMLLSFESASSMLVLGAILSSVTAMVGSLAFSESDDRFVVWKKIFLTGLFLSLLALLVLAELGLELTARQVGTYFVVSVVWGILLLATLPVWESLFDVISPFRLLELSNPSNPLLKRMQFEAPGTYHHTLFLASLAEAAADKLGLNGLLVRTGAYYHDIGKLKRPRFFVENQIFGENPHDEMSPSLSALVILSHVRDGVEIAKEYKLPAVLLPFIMEHHGTTSLSYFMKKAKAIGESVSEEQFGYPGPRPQSKETALVMMADSVEAAVKGIGKRNLDVKDFSLFIDEVIDSKIRAGQFDDVDFTLKDLAQIKDVFAKNLWSMYHSREVKSLPPEGGAPENKTLKEGKGSKDEKTEKAEKGDPKEKDEKRDRLDEIEKIGKISEKEDAKHEH